MVFSSTIFVFLFLPITLLLYFIIPNRNFKNVWLLFVSLVFFSWSQLNYLWIIIFCIIVNYTGALAVHKIKNASYRKFILALFITLNLGVLFYFKYFTFTLETINNLFKSTFSISDIILPIGISFFTFQGISYLIDVYKNDVPVQKNLIKVALYITLFPQLIAGPIVRYKTIASEIDNRKNTLSDFTYGIERFIIGLSKKTILANSLAFMADSIWNIDIGGNAISVAWLGSIAYSLQIFFDFSGYSDMAIGLGRMFGFHFNENFDSPYISKSISEFWRRWHISLSSWFRDYVYIPLGGNRKNVYLNLAIVFLLTGIWHGAAWTFIIWGIWHGLFILIERKLNANKKADLKPVKALIASIYTLFVVNIGWVLFRAPDIKSALLYIGNMFGYTNPDVKPIFQLSWYMTRWNIFILLISIALAFNVHKIIAKPLLSKINTNILFTLKYMILLGLFGLSIFRIIAGTYNPFIYFQF